MVRGLFGMLNPTMLHAPPGCDMAWWADVWAAWLASKAGSVDIARTLYQKADSCQSYELNADLSVLRHNPGEGSGTVHPVPPTEDNVVGVFLPYMSEPTCGETLVGVPTERAIDQFTWPVESDRPHIMVLSTGRCGTVSLFQLFQNSNLEPYHTYWFMQNAYTRWEFMCRLFEDRHEDTTAAMEWAATRKAEWLGEKPMIGLNHSDTIYAPLFAKAHPKSKFVYLRRNPCDVYDSFVEKDQWSGGANHFRPLLYDFDGRYRYSIPHIYDADGARWHIRYTEDFSRAFGHVMGDRFLEISSDRLFAQDREEVAKLLEFTGSDIDLDFAVEHFSRKINEKAHKCLS